jgi:SAM-dependent methyltransferase
MVDLGMSPLCESYLTGDQLNDVEAFYPLRVFVCGECFLVQLQEYVRPEAIFSEYAYFSSYSTSWLRHAADYVTMITDRLNLTRESHVVELASNDGYLLRYFVERDIPVLGIEPAANVAAAARQIGVPTQVAFFGARLAQQMVAEGKAADLVIGNNVLAQVPDVNDFVAGIRILLKPGGIATLEFPHLHRLIEGNQFDTIYHEHFSYFSLLAVERLLAAHRLTLFDVEELGTHGGSLRVSAGRVEDCGNSVTDRVHGLRHREQQLGYQRITTYQAFEMRVRATKRQLLRFLIEAKEDGKSVAGYGAPGKGNTLLNYCGIRTDLLDFTVDRNPYKQGRFLPGTHIPILPPEQLAETKPDYILILPWNLREEIAKQLAYTAEWGARLVVPIPEPAFVN